MKKILLMGSIAFMGILTAQSTAGLIIGEGVRIRTEGSAKGKEVSKVYGMRSVEIVEVSEKWDDLGKKDDMCQRHKWVKIKWAGDSTGWVYGKYCYQNDGSSCLLTKETSFLLKNVAYQLMIFQNYEYPVGDEQGLTGCNNTYKIMIYEVSSKNYYLIKDSKSKETESLMVFYSNMGQGENIKKISVQEDKIIIDVFINYQEGSATSAYTIEKNGGVFQVSNYQLSEVKYD